MAERTEGQFSHVLIASRAILGLLELLLKQFQLLAGTFVLVRSEQSHKLGPLSRAAIIALIFSLLVRW